MMQRESKAQRVERIKAAKNPLEVIKDIYRYAKSGETVDDETVDRLKWYGMYPHNKHSNDEKKSLYMIRIKLPSGKVNLNQLEALRDISHRFAKNCISLSVRQNVQLHYIEFKNLPEIFEMLENVGLSAQMASGDCPRSIVTCPLSGINDDEIFDTSEIFSKLNQYFQGNVDYINLPRKYKMGVCGCKNRCLINEVQDLSFLAFNDNDKIRFNVYTGGGLGSNKRFSTLLGSIKEEQIISVASAVTALFRDFGNRENRSKARLGHLIDSMGILDFQKKLEELIGFKIEKSDEIEKPLFMERNHLGLTKSINKKSYHIGFKTESGNIGGTLLKDICSIMKEYSLEKIALTTAQNFIVLDVSCEQLESLEKSFEKIGFSSKPSAFKAKALACTGIEFCKFGVSETKGLQKSVISYLEEKFPDFDENISITFNGCSNSCVHPHLSHIGLIGAKVNGESGFRLVLGAKMDGGEKEFAKKSNLKASSSEIHLLLEKIISDYLKEKDNFKDFNEYLTCLI